MTAKTYSAKVIGTDRAPTVALIRSMAATTSPTVPVCPNKPPRQSATGAAVGTRSGLWPAL